MQRISTFLCAAFVLLNTNCDENQQIRTVDSLGARLAAYTEDGAEKTMVPANSNILFVLSFINKSDVDIKAATYYDYCSLFNIKDFLLIYKLVRLANGEARWMAYGKPYELPVYCPTIAIPVIVPAHGETKVHGSSWNRVPNNPPFTPGKYYTAFSFDLELDGQSRRHDLNLEFEVY